MSGEAVRLRDVTRRFETPAGVVPAVDGVSLDIATGSSVAVTGPSGSGKSTLLGLVGGLDAPTAGSVWIGDRDIAALSTRERNLVRRTQIGHVFQSDNLLPFLTAAENVSVRCSMGARGRVDRDPDARSLELLRALGLEEEADRLPDQLSGGQRQRVAVARAVAHRPTLIVADEPTGSLDPGAAATVIDVLLQAQRRTGATMILVTHEPDVATRLDRAVRMLDGRIVIDDRVDQMPVLPRPADPPARR